MAAELTLQQVTRAFDGGIELERAEGRHHVTQVMELSPLPAASAPR